MNKILEDYIDCVRKRLLVDHVAGEDAAVAIAIATWRQLTKTRSRTIIRDSAPLREALARHGFLGITRDCDLRSYLKGSD